MDENRKTPASPAAGAPLNALNAMSPNQQRFDLESSVKARLFEQDQRRDSVQERAARFDQLANNGRTQQQKSTEASLKRALVGLEEAEKLKKVAVAEATRVKMELQVKEAFIKKVSHRNEELLEYISRLKETHSHITEVKDKDVARWRKSSTEHGMMLKKMQDKYNNSQTSLRKANADLDKERERSGAREHEASETRTQLAALQEELAAAIEKIKNVEQERDALKTVAKSEEIARIAAEGQLPLPKAKHDDEFGSPRKSSTALPKLSVVSSEATEEEIEQLREALEQERHRADTAYDLVEYMNLECEYKCCLCRLGSKSEAACNSKSRPVKSRPLNTAPPPTDDMMEDVEMGGVEDTSDAMEIDVKEAPLRTSTIFVPAEGIFRTVPSRNQQPPKSYRTSAEQMPPPSFTANRESTSSRQSRQSPIHSVFQARTPSCEPPAFANNVMLPTEASMISFGSAPASAAPSPISNESKPAFQQQEFRREQHQPQQTENVIFQHHLHRQADPVHPADLAQGSFRHSTHRGQDRVIAHADANPEFAHKLHGQSDTVMSIRGGAMRPPPPPAKRSAEKENMRPEQYQRSENQRPESHRSEHHHRPEHNFRTISTTTRIQLKPEDDDTPTSATSATHHHLGGLTRCESTLSEPAISSTTMITPKVSREEALAMIRERRGRARSMHQADEPKKEAPKTPKRGREPSQGSVLSTSQRNARSVSRGRLHGL